MALKLYDDNDIRNIASAIRNRNGLSTKYKMSQMATAITKIPNSYSTADEGKVVSNSKLITQTSRTITSNGTYNTTTNKSITVNVSGGETDTKFVELLQRTISTYTGSESYVGNHAFATCSNLSYVNMPNLTTAGNSAFYQCTALSSIDLPNLTEFGSLAFAYTILSYVYFPKLLSTGSNAFFSCKSLISVDLPIATRINNSTFSFCSNLQVVSIPNVSYLGSYAFGDCTKLSTLSLPAITWIGNGAFIDCTSLRSLYIGTSNCSLPYSNAFNSSPLSSGGTGTIYVPSEYLTTYKTASIWKYFSKRMVGY